MADPTAPLPAGSTIGILGGGQLGRMLAIAAAPLGYKCHVFDPGLDGPASHVSAKTTQAEFSDLEAVRQFASECDVVTYEFENIPLATAEAAADGATLAPNTRALKIAQHRVREKQFFNELGIATAPWRPIRSAADLKSAAEELGTPCILKTSELGYDGKGQVKLTSPADAANAWQELGLDEVGPDAEPPAVLEGFVPFIAEASVLFARSGLGEMKAYPIVDNVHRDHILHTSTVPSMTAPIVEEVAHDTAERSALALEYVGVMAVELFILEDNSVLVNEMAPRVHNSGHWSIEGAVTSQFEQHVRAIANLPLGSANLRGAVQMRNLIGDEVRDATAQLIHPDVHLHLYGKTEPRPGRKMGHITTVKPS